MAERTLVSSGRSELTVSVVQEVGPMLARSGLVIEFAFAVPKGEWVDWLLGKASELRVGRFEPVVVARCVPGRMNLPPEERGRRISYCISISAAGQWGLKFLRDLR